MRYNSFLHIFPEQCAKYLHDKFKMHSELTIRELMVILKHMGIKTVKVHINGKIYDVFSKRYIYGIQDFEFLNNLHEYRKIKQIRDEWSKEPLIDYTPELSNMQNASDELLKSDDTYYTNESKQIEYNMKKDNKKTLYESIMTSVAKEVKKALNEELDQSEYDKIPEDAGFADENGEVYAYDGKPTYNWYKYFGDCINTVDVDEMWDATQMAQVLRESEVLDDITWILPKLINGDRKIPGKLKQKLYDLQRFKHLDQIHDMSEIVAAINEEQEILAIYVSDFDTHFFFDCCMYY